MKSLSLDMYTVCEKTEGRNCYNRRFDGARVITANRMGRKNWTIFKSL